MVPWGHQQWGVSTAGSAQGLTNPAALTSWDIKACVVTSLISKAGQKTPQSSCAPVPGTVRTQQPSHIPPKNPPAVPRHIHMHKHTGIEPSNTCGSSSLLQQLLSAPHSDIHVSLCQPLISAGKFSSLFSTSSLILPRYTRQI